MRNFSPLKPETQVKEIGISVAASSSNGIPARRRTVFDYCNDWSLAPLLCAQAQSFES